VIRISWERLAALAGVAFVVLYAAAFGFGIEVGASDREILDHYADSGNRPRRPSPFSSSRRRHWPSSSSPARCEA
jgi:hypothetical protein